MVTPTSLNGAGCAAARLAASAVANNKAENTVVFIRYLPVEPDFTLGLPSDVNAISPRECGKASRGGIFPRCRTVAGLSASKTRGRRCRLDRAAPDFAAFNPGCAFSFLSRAQMRTPEVVKATAAGSRNFSNDTAAPIAMAPAARQEMM